MKKLLTVLLSVAILASCDSKKENQNSAILSGKIINPNGETVSLQIGEETLTDSLNENNEFRILVDLEEATEATFKHGEEVSYLYLKPGYNLSLSLNTDQFDETLKYTGTGSDINNFKASLVLYEDSVDFNPSQLVALPEDSFLMVVDDYYMNRYKLINGTGITDEQFIDNYLRTEKWKYIGLLVDYPAYKAYRYEKDYQVSDSFLTYRDTVDLNDEKNLTTPYFLSTLRSIIYTDAKRAIEKANPDQKEMDSDQLQNEMIAQIENLTNEAVKRSFYFETIEGGFSRMPEDVLNKYLKNWRALNPSKEKLDEIERKLAKWERLQPGNMAPGFTYTNIDGEKVSMKDLVGKVVYIDVWATWCGPCIQEQPAMEKLQNELKDEDVTFVAISIDSNKDSWEKMVKERELGGVQLFAENAWDSDIINDYMIKGIPRFVLIDQEGKIVNSNASRPSGSALEDIKALL